VPGVRAVRADESSAASVPGEVAAGGSCEAGAEPDGHALVDALQIVQREKIRQLAAALKNHDPGPGFVALDNRGYNQPRGESPFND